MANRGEGVDPDGRALYTPATSPDVRRGAIIFFCAASAVAACTGGAYDPSGAEGVAAGAGAPRVTGVLFVEQVQGAGAAAQAGARFLRVVGVQQEAVSELVGAPAWPLPRVSPVAGSGVCVERRGVGHALQSPDTAPEVRLLDVGPIDVTAGDTALRLTPRRFPDLWNVVSGVLYGVDSTLPSGVWRFSGGGGAVSGVGPFEVSMALPESLEGVTLDEQPLGADGAVLLPRRGGASVRWQRSQRVDEGDVVTVVFAGAGELRCAVRDEGGLDLDAATVERARELLREGGAVSVHRLRARPFTAAGLDGGALVFDLSVRARAR